MVFSSAVQRQLCVSLRGKSDVNRQIKIALKAFLFLDDSYHHSLKEYLSEKGIHLMLIPLAVITFIFTNLILTLSFRAISEELYCQGSEEKWIQERCSAIFPRYE